MKALDTPLRAAGRRAALVRRPLVTQPAGVRSAAACGTARVQVALAFLNDSARAQVW